MGERHVADEQLSAFLDDELEEPVALRVTRHLADCDVCIEGLEELRLTRDALRGLPTVRAPTLTIGTPGRGGPSPRPRTARVVGALAMVGVLLSGAYVVGGEQGEVEPPMEMFLVDHVARTGGGPVPPPVGGSDP